MHFRHALTSLFLVFCCADIVTAQHALWRRQDPTPARGGDAGDNPPPSSVTNPPKSTNDGSAKTTNTGGNPTSTVTSTAQSGSSKANSTETRQPEDEKLPIQPSITPAVGITGMVLLLSGLVYTLIGIRHEWLLVFLSTAYVAALGVTVLIVYVMTPPVSDAIQGAYFVAVFMTGVIFGGLSLIFKEVTRGFGCLVGGFCLSMWFLCLKPGGLVTTTTGKAILIGVFSAVGWSLAFSQYTRNYGSIFCTAFGGAMLTIIGIDCFTRAGLKEFWIYVWDLNPNEFPLHTTTYPITRGMRAELACTVVLCILGLISQMKVWKMVKERKEKKEEERQQGEAYRDRRDSRFGKMIEQRNTQSLAAWEAAYGDQDSEPLHTASTTDTSTDTLKKSTSVREREIGGVELDELDRSTSHGTNGKSKSYEAARAAPNLDLDLGHTYGDYSSYWDELKSSKSSPNHSKKNSGAESDSNEPPIPALPFSPLMDQSGNTKSDNVARDVATAPGKDGHEVAPNNLEHNEREEQRSFEMARLEDDRASSVAATLDEDPDFDTLSKRFSVAASVLTREGLSPFDDENKDDADPDAPAETSMEEKDQEELVQPVSQTGEKNAEPPKDKTGEEPTEDASTITPLTDGVLPSAISKVAHVYRTNEWAKHVAEADQPELVEELDTDEPAIHVDVGRTEEAPRPVDAKTLTPEQAQPSFFKTATNPYRQNSDAQRRNSSSGTPVYAFRRAASSSSSNNPTKSEIPVHAFQRAASSSSNNPPKQEIGRGSVPLIQQPLVESPTEESYELPPNLMDERVARVSSRPTTANFNGITSPSNAYLPPVAESSNLPAQDSGALVVSDDMNLAQRKSLLQTPAAEPHPLRPSSAQQHRPITRIASTTNQNFIYDSHQPRRFSSVNAQTKQNAMLTQWRESLHQEAYDQPAFSQGQQARQSMLEQLRHKDYRELKQQSEKKKRESRMEMAMRTSNLTEKHRSAMRKMQAQATEASSK